MRKIILLLCCAIISSITFAQTETEHLTFKGIPIDGSLDSFVQKLKTQNLTYIKMASLYLWENSPLIKIVQSALYL